MRSHQGPVCSEPGLGVRPSHAEGPGARRDHSLEHTGPAEPGPRSWWASGEAHTAQMPRARCHTERQRGPLGTPGVQGEIPAVGDTRPREARAEPTQSRCSGVQTRPAPGDASGLRATLLLGRDGRCAGERSRGGWGRAGSTSQGRPAGWWTSVHDSVPQRPAQGLAHSRCLEHRSE